MQQAAQGYDGLQQALAPLIRQLERLDDRMRNDLDGLRKELDALRRDLVTKDSLKPQLDAMEKRLFLLEQDQISRQDKLWIRLGQVGAFIAILLSLFEFITSRHLIP